MKARNRASCTLSFNMPSLLMIGVLGRSPPSQGGNHENEQEPSKVGSCEVRSLGRWWGRRRWRIHALSDLEETGTAGSWALRGVTREGGLLELAEHLGWQQMGFPCEQEGRSAGHVRSGHRCAVVTRIAALNHTEHAVVLPIGVVIPGHVTPGRHDRDHAPEVRVPPDEMAAIVAGSDRDHVFAARR